ncbi:MAG: DNA recombination protein RmuC [Actinomycetota bacterium]|nr:DNA recombination protein RmuC [Actinomycetota bacterium]
MQFVIGALIAVVVVLGFGMVVMLRKANREEGAAPVSPEQAALAAQVAEMVRGQQELAGQIKSVNDNQVQASRAISETVARSQAELTKQVNARLEHVDKNVGTTLTDSAEKTAKSLGDLTARLETIDRAQQNIVGLADKVVSLQHVLDDNPARGAFGEVQLRDLVEAMLPTFAYSHQQKLENGKVVDCLIELPDPPGPIAVDAKFPLKAYQDMLAAEDSFARETASKQLTADTRKHVKDIADKYVGQSIDGIRSTSETALMFIPSEAVYAELHAHHPNVIADSHKLKVYLVSPTTLMATLTTVRAILRDVEMRKQAGVIQEEVGVLLTDIGRLTTRVGNLDRHFAAAAVDIEEIKTSAGKIETRGGRIETLDLDEPDELESGGQEALPLR